MKKLPFAHLDALNVALRWFGGSINRLDCFVASIDVSVVRDLVELGLMRPRWIGWEITLAGRQALAEHNITSFWDTRRG